MILMMIKESMQGQTCKRISRFLKCWDDDNITSNEIEEKKFKHEIIDHEPLDFSEKRALLELYHTTHGNYWKDNSGWNYPFTDPCRTLWKGVLCTIKNKKATILLIKLNDNNLSGKLPLFKDYKKSKDKKESVQQVFDKLPWGIGNEHIKTYLDESEDEIPALPNLAYFQLQNNHISGKIPSTFFNMENLIEFVIDNNNVSSSLPHNLGNAGNLKHLSIRFNPIIGSIPKSIGKLNNLQKLFLNNCRLDSEIPIEITQLSKLQSLDLSFNNFTGTFPQENFNQLKHFKIIGNPLLNLQR
jgi:hypothetical protein